MFSASRSRRRRVDYWLERLNESQSRERLAFLFIERAAQSATAATAATGRRGACGVHYRCNQAYVDRHYQRRFRRRQAAIGIASATEIVRQPIAAHL